jgi:hypothetical protein
MPIDEVIFLGFMAAVVLMALWPRSSERTIRLKVDEETLKVLRRFADALGKRFPEAGNSNFSGRRGEHTQTFDPDETVQVKRPK